MKKNAIIISLFLSLSLSSFAVSFESNFLKASRFLNRGKRIAAQAYIRRCIVNANKTPEYIKIAYLYKQINPKSPKVYIYLQKAYDKITNAEESIKTASSYLFFINNTGMVRHSLNKGLIFSRSLSDTFDIARGFKKLLGDNLCAANAINKGMMFAKSIRDLIRLSDVSYNEFDLIKCASNALEKCWKLASSKEDWLLIADAYKRIGITSKARLAKNRATISSW